MIFETEKDGVNRAFFSNGSVSTKPLLLESSDDWQGTCLGYPGAETKYPNFSVLAAEWGNPDKFIWCSIPILSELG